MDENVKCGQCGSTFNRMFLLGKQGNADVCPLCGGTLNGGDTDDKTADEHADWITWYYYGDKDDNGKTTTLRDKPLDLNKWDDEFLIKEFKAPPENNPGGLDEVKRILRTYVPNAFAPPEKSDGPVIRCPRCGSSQYTLLNKGYGLLTGFIGSGKIKRVCNYCKKEF
ncbi:hypothetical protein [Enterocloster bolteae]|uniref:hypothetical protein n=1 Tax=Enterocloster bolteae TaxID=208479 RepID=UPI0006C82625|nr:hypothetical protein [Enterocloster bolteae]